MFVVISSFYLLFQFLTSWALQETPGGGPVGVDTRLDLIARLGCDANGDYGDDNNLFLRRTLIRKFIAVFENCVDGVASVDEFTHCSGLLEIS